MVEAPLGRQANRILLTKKCQKHFCHVIVPNRRNNKALHGTRTENKNFKQLLSFKLSLKNQLTTSMSHNHANRILLKIF